MSKVTRWTLVTGLAAAIAAIVPHDAAAQRSSVEVWSANCGRCHNIQPPGRYSTKDWTSIVTHMTITARLTKVQADAVMSFLTSGAREVGAEAITTLSGLSPGQVYAQQCAVCHGAGGRGDGPGAAAFSVRPANLSSPDLWAQRTDEEIHEVIVNGYGAMPPLGAMLDQSTRTALIRYLRELYGGGE
jgi:cytochrome c5